MPLTMSANNSEFVMRGTYGFTMSGASVWPMKTLAETESVSAPLVPMRCTMTRAMTLHDALQDAVVIQHREKRGDEQDRRQRFEGEHEQEFLAGLSAMSPGLREIAEDEFRALVGKIDEVGRRRLSPTQDACERCGTFSTSTARMICSTMPQPIVRQFTARKLERTSPRGRRSKRSRRRLAARTDGVAQQIRGDSECQDCEGNAHAPNPRCGRFLGAAEPGPKEAVRPE